MMTIRPMRHHRRAPGASPRPAADGTARGGTAPPRHSAESEQGRGTPEEIHRTPPDHDAPSRRQATATGGTTSAHKSGGVTTGDAGRHAGNGPRRARDGLDMRRYHAEKHGETRRPRRVGGVREGA